jgi:hypothetical protein
MGEQLCQALLCDYVPTTMAVYGVFRPRLITYDVQWRATYFLSINLPFAPTAFWVLSENTWDNSPAI